MKRKIEQEQMVRGKKKKKERKIIEVQEMEK